MGTSKQSQHQPPVAPKPEPEDSSASNGGGDDDQGGKKKRAPRIPKAEGAIRRKRGPPRPHRKLTQEVLESRIGKLNKRIEKAKGHLEDAERHIDGYSKERKYREAEAELRA